MNIFMFICNLCDYLIVYLKINFHGTPSKKIGRPEPKNGGARGEKSAPAEEKNMPCQNKKYGRAD